VQENSILLLTKGYSNTTYFTDKKKRSLRRQRLHQVGTNNRADFEMVYCGKYSMKELLLLFLLILFCAGLTALALSPLKYVIPKMSSMVT
jgi:hypothetical protein